MAKFERGISQTKTTAIGMRSLIGVEEMRRWGKRNGGEEWVFIGLVERRCVSSTPIEINYMLIN